MTTQAILDELVKASIFKLPRDFDGEDQEVLEALSDAVSDMEEDDWEDLSEEAQAHFNKMARASNQQKDLPGFKLEDDEKPKRGRRTKKDDGDEEEEEKPKRARRTSRSNKDDEEEEEEKPKRGRASKSKAKEEEIEFGELEDGMNVKITNDRGRTKSGKVVEKDRKTVWIDDDGTEHEFSRAKIDVIFLVTEGADDDEEEEEKPSRSRRAKKDDDDGEDEKPSRSRSRRAKKDDDEGEDEGEDKKPARGGRASGKLTKLQLRHKTLIDNWDKTDKVIAGKLDDTVNEDHIRRDRKTIGFISKCLDADLDG